LIFDPKLIKSIAASKAYSFVKTDVARIWLEDMIGTENIVLAEGKVHQRTRKLFNPIFNLKNIKKMLPYFYQHTNELGQNFDRQLSEKNEIKLLTIDIIDIRDASMDGQDFRFKQNLPVCTSDISRIYVHSSYSIIASEISKISNNRMQG